MSNRNTDLNLDPNFTDADAFYAALTDLHRDCEPAISECINARLILLMANHIGDNAVLYLKFRSSKLIKSSCVGSSFVLQVHRKCI